MVSVKEEEPVIPVGKRLSGLNFGEVNTSKEKLLQNDPKHIIAQQNRIKN